MRPKRSILILPTFTRLMVLGPIALAFGGDPQTLFTDNVTAANPSVAITEMESSS